MYVWMYRGVRVHQKSSGATVQCKVAMSEDNFKLLRGRCSEYNHKTGAER